jgi:hypothetical protein
MPSPLTNTAWRKVCAAAAPHQPVPEAEARAALAAILSEEYPQKPYEHTIATIKRATRMLKNLAAFEADYRAEFPSGVWKTDRNYEIKRNIANKTERDLSCLKDLRRRTGDVLLLARARQRTRHQQHGMLYFRLCQLWLDHFQPGSELPPKGRFCTPLVNFILAAMRLVVPPSELPQPETVRDAIERERTERENLKPGGLVERLRRELEGG